VTHDIEEAVFLADVIFVLSHRPARVLHRVEVPYFAERDVAVKQSESFKKVSAHLLELLRSLEVHGNVRVGL
jgi:ABC-type nitrate/sulfonate/bicarbonate transport system ATPase subunit